MARNGYSVFNRHLRRAESGDSMSDERLIEKFSYRLPDGVGQHVRTVSESIEIKEPRMYYRPESTIGNLEKFPIELLHNIFEVLDLQSLLRFSRASVRASTLVQTSPVYRDLIEYAHRGLAALAFSRLISYHPAGALRAALRSQNCFSCGHYGPLLFLPSCQRCCWICALRNPSLWVLPRAVAARCFCIPLRQVDQLPCILRLPTHSRGRFEDREPQNFVSVVCAKRLALAIHGSEENIRDLPFPTYLIPSKQELYAHYRAAQLQPYPTDPLLRPYTMYKDIEDPYEGNAHTLLPSIASGVVDHGFLCKGCNWIRRDLYSTSDEYSGFGPFRPHRRWPRRHLRHFIFRARSREDFLRHIRVCYGVRQILASNGPQHWLQELAHIPIDEWA